MGDQTLRQFLEQSPGTHRAGDLTQRFEVSRQRLHQVFNRMRQLGWHIEMAQKGEWSITPPTEAERALIRPKPRKRYRVDPKTKRLVEHLESHPGEYRLSELANKFEMSSGGLLKIVRRRRNNMANHWP